MDSKNETRPRMCLLGDIAISEDFAILIKVSLVIIMSNCEFAETGQPIAFLGEVAAEAEKYDCAGVRRGAIPDFVSTSVLNHPDTAQRSAHDN